MSTEINEELMRRLATDLGKQSIITAVDAFPRGKDDRIVATFEPSLYPEPVRSARLEFRLYFDGDVNHYYSEDWGGSQWECRWDRHPNSHNTREHFHYPPTYDGEHHDSAVDAELPSDPPQLIKLALNFVQDRINDLWTQAGEGAYVFPSEYTYSGEYGPAFERNTPW